MKVSVLDALSSILLLAAFIGSNNAKKEKERQTEENTIKRRDQFEKLEKNLTALEKRTIEEEQMLRAAKEYLDWEAAKGFMSWYSVRSFVVSLSFALVTFFLGWSSLPGCIFGMINSSPRGVGKLIYLFHRLFGSKP